MIECSAVLLPARACAWYRTSVLAAGPIQCMARCMHAAHRPLATVCSPRQRLLRLRTPIVQRAASYRTHAHPAAEKRSWGRRRGLAGLPNAMACLYARARCTLLAISNEEGPSVRVERKRQRAWVAAGRLGHAEHPPAFPCWGRAARRLPSGRTRHPASRRGRAASFTAAAARSRLKGEWSTRHAQL